MSASVKLRIAVERAIVMEVARAILKRGWWFTIDNGSEDIEEQAKITKIEDVRASIMLTDEDTFFIYEPGTKPQDGGIGCTGWVKFIYGNSGTDVVHDYSKKLEEMMATANMMAEAVDLGKFEIAMAIPDKVDVEHWEVSGVHTGYRVRIWHDNVPLYAAGFSFDVYKSGTKDRAQVKAAAFAEGFLQALRYVYVKE